jgi:hypothetical protein
LWLLASASAEWKEQVLYSFQGGTDAATPQGGVVFDKQGNLYGTALGGTEWGTVFQLVPPVKKGDPWTESVIFEFQGKLSNDGQTPTGGLIIDADGNLYGVTGYGGTGNCVLLGITVGCGTAYELSPPKQKGGKWTETILHSFQSGKDGYYPWGTLTFDSVGNLYGSTYYGGGYGSCNSPYYQYCGTVFKLSPPKTKGGKWKEEVLYSFKGVPSGKESGDGADPNGGLVLDSKGNIYGTTYFGGNNQPGTCQGGVGGTGCGIVFRLGPRNQNQKWSEEIIHHFQAGSSDGSNPAAGVTFGKNGTLYGTTYFGPMNRYGIAFRLSKPSGKSGKWKEAVYDFTNGNDGAYPDAGLIVDDTGNVYGTNIGGDRGTVFELKPPGDQKGAWKDTTIYKFAGPPNGWHPAAVLSKDAAGDLYGTTQWGGGSTACQGGCGIVFELVK